MNGRSSPVEAEGEQPALKPYLRLVIFLTAMGVAAIAMLVPAHINDSGCIRFTDAEATRALWFSATASPFGALLGAVWGRRLRSARWLVGWAMVLAPLAWGAAFVLVGFVSGNC